MDFLTIKKPVQQQFNNMAKTGLFKTDVSKELLWDTYLGSFKPGTNPMFRERTEHDCQCCKSFIRAAGNIVTIIDNKLVSIWDVVIPNDYQAVADAMSALVKSAAVRDMFLTTEPTLGTDISHEHMEGDGASITWDHFYCVPPSKVIVRSDEIGKALGMAKTTQEVFKRGCAEITVEGIDTVLELIAANSIYRGAEFQRNVEDFRPLLVGHDALEVSARDNYCWSVAERVGGLARLKNSAIGTLLVDVSNDVDLVQAVNMFGSKMDGYKVVTALATPTMLKNAQKKIDELGIEPSLYRRHATLQDITINNVIFADQDAQEHMAGGILDELIAQAGSDVPKNFDKIEEVDVTTFLDKIMPKATSIEVLLENRHQNNMVTLVAPLHPHAPNILKWGNNFSWSYKGEVADSMMKEKVKAAGGAVDGVMRCSVLWNRDGMNNIDFDAHCTEPTGNLISYPKKTVVQASSGVLDVDIMSPRGSIAVENITWSNINKMPEGIYEFVLHNYSRRTSKGGFEAEVEFGGVIHSFTYAKNVKGNEKVLIAKIKFSKDNGIEILKSLPSTQTNQEIWGVTTNKFQKVAVVMNSPNHWDGDATGNKHLFFMLDKCKNPDDVRGFYNEFLNESLSEYRKVFGLLGSKLRVAAAEEQLSGLGFSSTKKNQIVCRVSGAISRTLKVNL